MNGVLWAVAVIEYLAGVLLMMDYIEDISRGEGHDRLDVVDYGVIATWPVSTLLAIVVGRFGSKE